MHWSSQSASASIVWRTCLLSMHDRALCSPGQNFSVVIHCKKNESNLKQPGLYRWAPRYQGRSWHVALGAWRHTMYRPLSRTLSVVISFFMICSKGVIVDGTQCRKGVIVHGTQCCLVVEHPVVNSINLLILSLLKWLEAGCPGIRGRQGKHFSFYSHKETGPGAQPASTNCVLLGSKSTRKWNL